jgi:hypothetical protein
MVPDFQGNFAEQAPCRRVKRTEQAQDASQSIRHRAALVFSPGGCRLQGHSIMAETVSDSHGFVRFERRDDRCRACLGASPAHRLRWLYPGGRSSAVRYGRATVKRKAMLRDQNGHGDEDCQYEEQDGASDAAASRRKVPGVVGASHLNSK